MGESDLGSRIEALEDREAIRELGARYCYLVDDGKFEELSALFLPDAVCVFEGAGTFTGWSELRRFFAELLPARLRNMTHTVHNHVIELSGDRATARSYFELTAVSSKAGKEVVGAGRYHDTLVRTAEGWKFARREASFFFLVHLSKGWARPAC